MMNAAYSSSDPAHIIAPRTGDQPGFYHEMFFRLSEGVALTAETFLDHA